MTEMEGLRVEELFFFSWVGRVCSDIGGECFAGKGGVLSISNDLVVNERRADLLGLK